MRRWLQVLVVLAAVPVLGEELVVGYQKTVQVAVPGGVAAYVLNPSYVDARMEDEVLILRGKVPGATSVVVVLREGTRAYNVRVPEPPPSLPPGFDRSATQGDSYGSYELRYSSGPAQLQNVVDLFRRDDARTLRVHVASAALFSGVPGRSRFNLPSAFLQITTASREITLGDLMILNSPLSVNGATVRGLHFRQGPVTFHAGYTSTSEFQEVLLPATREGVLGFTVRHPLSENSTLTFNAFHFSRGSGSTLSRNSRAGSMASLVYEYKPRESLSLEAEAGLSNGVFAGSLLFRFQRPGEQLNARVRYQPREFASLASQYRSGFFSDVNWTRQLTPKLRTDIRVTGNRYSLTTYDQTNLHSSLEMQYKFNRNWSVLSGLAYARYEPHQPLQATVESMSVPLGLNFDSRRFGTSFQYRFSRVSGSDLGSHQLRGTVRASLERLRFTAFVDRQTQAPTVDLVFRELPGLAEAVAQLGLTATTPEELARLLEGNPALAGLGYIEGVNFHLSPVRLQAGGTASWISRRTGRHQFNYSFLYNRNQGVGSSSVTALHNWTYAVRLNGTNDLFVSFSLLRSSLQGQGTDSHPLLSFSLRHTFNNVPHFLLPSRTGTIAGTVFLDETLQGRITEDQPRLADVEMVLDGTHRTRTDGRGRYAFSHLAPGRHTIEAVYHSQEPFFFTTDSRTESDINGTVDFGIATSRAPLTGLVRSDAGLGIAQVNVSVSCRGKNYAAETDGEGKFRLAGLPPGRCEVAIQPESVPPGYLLEALEPVHVIAEAESPAHAEITLKAIRAVSGMVMVYEPTVRQDVPLPGAVVRIEALGLQSTSDSNGRFLFRGLPPGDHVVVVTHHGAQLSRRLSVPAGPSNHTDFDFELAGK